MVDHREIEHLLNGSVDTFVGFIAILASAFIYFITNLQGNQPISPEA